MSPPIQPRGSAPRPSQSPEMDQNNFDNELNLEVKCNQDRCSGNGLCVEIEGVATCQCSEGYSGSMCQDPVAKGMPGAIIYGAAGLGAAILVIAVIAVVVLKKKGASRLVMSELFEI